MKDFGKLPRRSYVVTYDAITRRTCDGFKDATELKKLMLGWIKGVTLLCWIVALENDALVFSVEAA